MKASKECFRCLSELADQVIRLSTTQTSLRRKMREEVDRILAGFAKDLVPTDISNQIHHLAKVLSSNIDPYRDIKRREIRLAREIAAKLKSPKTVRDRVRIAALGNSLDHFIDIEELRGVFRSPIEFALDDIDQFSQRLRKCRRVLYIPDNAGELYFDIPLLEYLSERADVFYSVKSEPVQNDLSLDDLNFLDGIQIPATLIKGPPTVGVYLSQAPVEFKMAFDIADLIISKGMANYETLSEFSSDDRVFYILRAKCKPVARSLGVKVGDYVASFLNT